MNHPMFFRDYWLFYIFLGWAVIAYFYAIYLLKQLENQQKQQLLLDMGNLLLKVLTRKPKINKKEASD